MSGSPQVDGSVLPCCPSPCHLSYHTGKALSHSHSRSQPHCNARDSSGAVEAQKLPWRAASPTRAVGLGLNPRGKLFLLPGRGIGEGGGEGSKRRGSSSLGFQPQTGRILQLAGAQGHAEMKSGFPLEILCGSLPCVKDAVRNLLQCTQGPCPAGGEEPGDAGYSPCKHLPTFLRHPHPHSYLAWLHLLARAWALSPQTWPWRDMVPVGPHWGLHAYCTSPGPPQTTRFSPPMPDFFRRD